MAEIKRTFGEKIGGSRYDRWHAGDILTMDDIHEMTGQEQERLVKKDNIWPKPDYAALEEEGIVSTILYYRKIVRDSLPAKPRIYPDPNRTEKSCEQYVEFVSHVRDVMERVTDPKSMDMVSEGYTFLARDGFVVHRSYFLEPTNPYLTNKTLTAVRAGQRPLYLVHERTKHGFLMTKEEVILSQYTFLPMDPTKGSLEDFERKPCIRYEEYPGSTRWFYLTKEIDPLKLQEAWMDEEKKTDHAFLVTKGYTILSFGIPTREMAEDWALEHAPEEPARKKGKTKYLPPTLEHIVQNEGPTPILREGTTGEDLMETYGFRGGEFGEYESQADRQANLDMCYLAFHHLAAALSIDPKDVSLGGDLSIAFGARGRGGNVMAHFEPMMNVINLTKLKGAGSLGHEWIHALDYAIGREDGRDGLMTDKMTAAIRRSGWPKFADLVDGLRYDKNRNMTQFYENARKLDNTYQKTSGRYWSSSAELLARAGACYLYDKLKEQGIRDDYLVGHCHGALIAPPKEEQERFDQMFDEALEEFKKKGLLHDFKRDLEMEESRS